MTRKTILKLTTLLSCIILMTTLTGCKDSESDQAAKDSRESIDKGNRLIKSSTDNTALTESEIDKVAQIPTDISDTRLKQERQKLAMQVAKRLAAAAGDSEFEAINSKIEELEAVEINSQEDFENICSSLIEITDKIVELSSSTENAIASQQDTKLQAALAELKKAGQSIRKAPTEDKRRNTLNSACSLSLAAIYSSQARSQHESLILKDTDIHPILMGINTQVNAVRQANLDALAAKAARPEKALEGLNEQLTSAKDLLADTTAKLSAAKADLSKFKAEYEVNIAKANEYRDKYLDTLSKADKAEGAQRYKLEMEATMQRVGKDNMKKWAADWIEQGKDDEMKMLVNSSQDVIGGIHYETKAELAKLQMDSIDAQVKFYDSLAGNTRNRIAQLEAFINKLLTSEETTTDIQVKIDQAQDAKEKAIASIKTKLDELTAFEAGHTAKIDGIIELYQEAITNLEQYSSQTRSFGEFDPERFIILTEGDLIRLYEADAEFYNATIGVLDNVRSLPEMAEAALAISEEFLGKAQAAQDATSGTDETENADDMQ